MPSQMLAAFEGIDEMVLFVCLSVCLFVCLSVCLFVLICLMFSQPLVGEYGLLVIICSSLLLSDIKK